MREKADHAPAKTKPILAAAMGQKTEWHTRTRGDGFSLCTPEAHDRMTSQATAMRDSQGHIPARSVTERPYGSVKILLLFHLRLTI